MRHHASKLLFFSIITLFSTSYLAYALTAPMTSNVNESYVEKGDLEIVAPQNYEKDIATLLFEAELENKVEKVEKVSDNNNDLENSLENLSKEELHDLNTLLSATDNEGAVPLSFIEKLGTYSKSNQNPWAKLAIVAGILATAGYAGKKVDVLSLIKSAYPYFSNFSNLSNFISPKTKSIQDLKRIISKKLQRKATRNNQYEFDELNRRSQIMLQEMAKEYEKLDVYTKTSADKIYFSEDLVLGTTKTLDEFQLEELFAITANKVENIALIPTAKEQTNIDDMKAKILKLEKILSGEIDPKLEELLKEKAKLEKRKSLSGNDPRTLRSINNSLAYIEEDIIKRAKVPLAIKVRDAKQQFESQYFFEKDQLEREFSRIKRQRRLEGKYSFVLGKYYDATQTALVKKYNEMKATIARNSLIAGGFSLNTTSASSNAKTYSGPLTIEKMNAEIRNSNNTKTSVSENRRMSFEGVVAGLQAQSSKVESISGYFKREIGDGSNANLQALFKLFKLDDIYGEYDGKISEQSALKNAYEEYKKSIVNSKILNFQNSGWNNVLPNVSDQFINQLKESSKSLIIAPFLRWVWKVRSGGAWDLKNQNKENGGFKGLRHLRIDEEILRSDAPGNILFAYSGKALGIPEFILQAGAGGVQFFLC